MSCQKCGSDRLFRFYAKHSDMFVYTYKDKREVDGYAPHIPSFCGGDDTQGTLCLDCGQLQGKWPATDLELDEISEEDEDRMRQEAEEDEFEREYLARRNR